MKIEIAVCTLKKKEKSINQRSYVSEKIIPFKKGFHVLVITEILAKELKLRCVLYINRLTFPIIMALPRHHEYGFLYTAVMKIRRMRVP